MSKFLCKCGNVIRISGLIPNPAEWKFISDVAYDKFQGQVDSEEVYQQMRSFLKCEECGRLWVHWDGFDNPPTLYVPEDY
jgi:hypothetical protein